MNRRSFLVAATGAAIVLGIAGYVASERFGASAGSEAKFGGPDRALSAAIARGLGEAVDASSTASGVTVAVTGILADDTQTAIGLRIAGREDLGDLAFPRPAPTLIGDDGTRIDAITGSADPANKRHQTVLFPPLPASGTKLTLEIQALIIGRSGQRPAAGQAPQSTSVPGPWRVQFEWSGQKGSTVVLAAPVAPAEFAPGRGVVVDRIVQAASGTVVEGHLEGFSEDEIVEILLQGSVRTPAGESGMAGLEMGFGDGLKQFRMRFPLQTGPGITLTITPTLKPSHDAARTGALASLNLKPASWDVALP